MKFVLINILLFSLGLRADYAECLQKIYNDTSNDFLNAYYEEQEKFIEVATQFLQGQVDERTFINAYVRTHTLAINYLDSMNIVYKARLTKFKSKNNMSLSLPTIVINFKENIEIPLFKSYSALSKRFPETSINFGVASDLTAIKAGGAYQNNSIFLGFDSLINELSNNLEAPLGLLKHEVAHLILTKSDSKIYNMHYLTSSLSDSPLIDVKHHNNISLYQGSLGTQEIYTYSSDVSTSLSQAKNAKSYLLFNYFIKQSKINLQDLSSITQSLANLATGFVDSIKTAKSTDSILGPGQINIIASKGSSESIIIRDKSNRMLSIAPNKDQLKKLKKYSRELYKLKAKYGIDESHEIILANIKDKNLIKDYKKFLKSKERLLSKILNSQKLLEKIAIIQNKRALKLQTRIDNWLEDVNQSNYNSASNQKILKEILSEARELAVGVREQYNGFIGRSPD